jgi:hypothetical protein
LILRLLEGFGRLLVASSLKQQFTQAKPVPTELGIKNTTPPLQLLSPRRITESRQNLAQQMVSCGMGGISGAATLEKTSCQLEITGSQGI